MLLLILYHKKISVMASILLPWWNDDFYMKYSNWCFHSRASLELMDSTMKARNSWSLWFISTWIWNEDALCSESNCVCVCHCCALSVPPLSLRSDVLLNLLLLSFDHFHQSAHFPLSLDFNGAFWPHNCRSLIYLLIYFPFMTISVVPEDGCAWKSH